MNINVPVSPYVPVKMFGATFQVFKCVGQRVNPVELVCHELKEYIRSEVKPWSKQELIDGSKAFWNTIAPTKCQKYIGHLKKVVECNQEYVRDKRMQSHILLLTTFCRNDVVKHHAWA